MKFHRITVLLALTLAAGCATTRVVKQRPGSGGEIMVKEGFFGDARADATKKMKSNCGRRKIVILEEGEAVIGSRTEGEKKKTSWGAVANSSRTEQETEWRIKYKCKK
jgi:hypothetical protein